MTRFGGLLVGMVLFLARAGAAAEVDWRGPGRCPDSDEVRFRIERAIGMPLSHAAPLRFAVHAQRAARGFVAHIDVDRGSGGATRQRDLAAAECGQLADMVTVAVALALGAVVDGDAATELDPARGGGAAAGTPGAHDAGAGMASTATGVATSQGAGEASADSADPARRDAVAHDVSAGIPSDGSSARWRPGASLGLVADAGSLPEPGLGASAGLSIGREQIQLRASGTWFLEQHASVDTITEAPAGADLAFVIGALSVCALPLGTSDSRFVAFGCGGWELGRLAGEGTGVPRPRRGASLWNAPRLDAGTRLALGSTDLHFDVRLTLAVPLARENFVLDDVGSVHRPSAVVGRASIGLEWIPK
jgi:hypothetical protein